jgi:K+-transporting ATPase ATPase C chain
MNMLRLFLGLSLLCGVLYPLGVTVVAQLLFSERAQGSQVKIEGKLVGSSLLAQKFVGEGYFHPRPSAGDFATVSSAASQHSPTHRAGTEAREQRRTAQPSAGVDAWTTSGSGLDPHVSLQTAIAQIPRVAAARGMAPEELTALIEKLSEGPTLGIWGRSRVNVLELNLAIMSKGMHANAGTAPQ